MELSGILNLMMSAAILGGVLYLFNLLPLDPLVKKVSYTLIVFLVVLWAIHWLLLHAH